MAIEKNKENCLLTSFILHDKFNSVDLRNCHINFSEKIAEKFLTDHKSHDKITKSLKENQ